MMGGVTTTAFEEYALLRIEELTRTCVDPGAPLEQIRLAQASIQEMKLIVDLRDRLKMEWESTNEPA